MKKTNQTSALRPEFTLAEAFKIQANQIAEWKLVLKPSVHKALLQHAREHNESVINPYDVFRGVQIAEWVNNHINALLGNNRITIYPRPF